jgi:DNA-binding CsgD family transcriptional regulator
VRTRPRWTPARGVVPAAALDLVVVLVTVGLARGLWLDNLHNGVLALACTAVGGYVLHQRPGHRQGRLFLATGVAEAVLFLGRQVGHAPGGPGSAWWGWLGVWPVAVVLGLTTLAVLCFPDGRLPSPRWRPVAGLVVAVAVVCAVLSALWPVEYSSVDVLTAHPVADAAPPVVQAVWSALAHPSYVVSQVLWVVAVAARWRTASPGTRRQLGWLLLAVLPAGVALLVGLVGWGSPRAGVLAAALVPVAAGLAVVHGQHAGARAALSWLSRARRPGGDLAGELTKATGTALDAARVVLWSGADTLLAVGVWPDPDADLAPTTPAAVHAIGETRDLVSGGVRVGVLAVEPGDDPLSLAQQRLLDDLAAQATLVVEHLGLAAAVRHRPATRPVPELTPRERDVLALMARGLSNTAIAAELHLSVKTVEPVVSTVFGKLGLQPDTRDNRRVLAVLAYLER